jgi:Peptidase S24-like
VEKDEAGKIVPGRLFHAVPVLGTVTAGFPSPADEELGDTMSLDEFLITNKEATYILKVNGESMIEAGILSGDLLLVEAPCTHFPGQFCPTAQRCARHGARVPLASAPTARGRRALTLRQTGRAA